MPAATSSQPLAHPDPDRQTLKVRRIHAKNYEAGTARRGRALLKVGKRGRPKLEPQAPSNYARYLDSPLGKLQSRKVGAHLVSPRGCTDGEVVPRERSTRAEHTHDRDTDEDARPARPAPAGKASPLPAGRTAGSRALCPAGPGVVAAPDGSSPISSPTSESPREGPEDLRSSGNQSPAAAAAPEAETGCRDFTPVCTTELGRAVKLAPEFAKRNVKLIALSLDSVEDHLAWSKDINAYNCDEPTEKLPFPIIDDKNRDLAILLGMLDPAEKDEKGMPVTARGVFIFGPDKKLKLSILYPATTGRNFDELLRVVISLQLTAEKRVATPVDWKNGDSVMVLPTIPEDEAKKLFPKGVFTKELPSGKKYLRYTPQP
ncbi:Peroxiredoxin-6 [Galemys pyrenaicus]|uniref:Peroxiredoxin-6 n=1 Tax=Galemys pyrenaicus TaxID=202257 RepID=A0A8J6BBV2_GALPY|nr:Peroxiredoxin-6 [Galemys pyrenaicus]